MGLAHQKMAAAYEEIERLTNAKPPPDLELLTNAELLQVIETALAYWTPGAPMIRPGAAPLLRPVAKLVAEAYLLALAESQS